MQKIEYVCNICGDSFSEDRALDNIIGLEYSALEKKRNGMRQKELRGSHRHICFKCLEDLFDVYQKRQKELLRVKLNV